MYELVGGYIYTYFNNADPITSRDRVQRIPENRKLPYPTSVYCFTYGQAREFIFVHIFRRGDKTPASTICFYDLAESCREK
jgi:hypothetical protein